MGLEAEEARFCGLKVHSKPPDLTSHLHFQMHTLFKNMSCLSPVHDKNCSLLIGPLVVAKDRGTQTLDSEEPHARALPVLTIRLQPGVE